MHPAQDAVTARLLAVAEERDMPITVADVAALAAAALAMPQASPASTLTNQQIGVLVGLAVGDSVEATARRMCLTTHTVKSHRAAAYRQLGARSAAQAVATAMSLGLLRTGTAPFPMPGQPDQVIALETEVSRLQQQLAELEKDTAAWAATSTPSAASTAAALGRLRDAQATVRGARACPS
ncbi:helix-turn-helix transcriptional regulator [Streptomyces sp. NPDC057136]|uniref:helix-turn-helix domain-containing protein n=1 Tax=Streptomyces sp. NPDC057136 TaxID=3346029 RepID=UPI003640AA78